MKRIRLFLIMFICLFLATACQPTPETPPVASKNDGALEKAIHEGAPAGYVYTAPKSYSSTNSFCDGKVIINADNCTVLAAQGAVYPVYEAQSKKIDKEMLMNIYKVCFGESKMTFHSTQLTKDEIEQEIIRRKQQLFDIENGQYDPSKYSDGVDYTDEYDEKELVENIKSSISLLEKEKQTAPAETVRTPIKWEEYTDGASLDADVRMANGKTGRFYFGGNTIAVNFDYDAHDPKKNFIKHDSTWENQGAVPSSYYLLGDEQHLNYIKEHGSVLPDFTIEKAEAYAAELIEKLGFGNTYYLSDIGAASSDMPNCYAVCFMRRINDKTGLIGDDVSTRHGRASGEDIITGKSYSSPFDYEQIVCWVDKMGVRSFFYKAPLEITRTMADSVKLADIDVCAENLTDYIRRQLTMRYSDDDDTGFDATEHIAKSNYIEKRKFTCFELAYAQVKEKNSDGRFLLIPAWYVSHDSSGIVIKKDGGEESEYVGSDFRIYVINAIDGTVIDRYLGY